MVNRTPFSEIFGQVMDCAALGDEIRDVSVSDIRIFREERALTLALVLTRVVSYVWYRRLLDAVSRALDLRRLDCRLTFDGLPLDEAGVVYQTAEIGRVDLGGGGTIAYILALYGMNVIDSGVAVLNMHAPWEATSKADIYEALKGYIAFLEKVKAV